MLYIFSASGRKKCELLFSTFSDESDEFMFCKDGLSLLDSVIFGDRRADLIFLDCLLYRNFSDFIYNLLKSKNIRIPIIMFGGENSDSDRRIQNWIAENEIRYDIQNLHLLIPVFTRIDAALRSENVRVMLEEKESRFEDDKERLHLRSKKKQADLIEDFRKKTDLPPSIHNLLAFLYKNNARDVSIEEIMRHLNISLKSDKSGRNIVYAYIARLRKCIDNTPLCSLEILRTRTGYYRLLLH